MTKKRIAEIIDSPKFRAALESVNSRVGMARGHLGVDDGAEDDLVFFAVLMHSAWPIGREAELAAKAAALVKPIAELMAQDFSEAPVLS